MRGEISMDEMILYIIRGIPGSGKTTLARKLCPDHNYAADDYFYDAEGNYKFDFSKLDVAHRHCMKNVENAMMSDKINIFSNMVVFSSYGMQVIMSFLMLTLTFMMAPRAQISAKRINEVLDENLNLVEDYKNGKRVFDYIIGQIMKKSNPEIMYREMFISTVRILRLRKKIAILQFSMNLI